MKIYQRVLVLSCQSLILLLALGARSAPTVAQQGISGTYWVVGTTDLGPEVRVNLHIQLANMGNDRLFITGIGLREDLHKSRDLEPFTVILLPHGREILTHEFTLPQREYELWQKGLRPRLSLKIQEADNEATTLTISLVRRAL